MSELFELYIKSGLYLRGWSPKTAVIYRRAYVSFLKTNNEFTKSGLEAWIISRREAGMSPCGINMYIRAMNSFSAWLLEEKHSTEAIVLKQLKAPQKAIQVFDSKDISLLLSFKPRGFYELRTWTLLQCLLDTGCRIDEVLGIRINQVNLDELNLRVMGKGNKERVVPISIELRKLLFRHLQVLAKRVELPSVNRFVFCAHNGSKLMYRNVMRDVRNLCKKVGITKHVRLHLTRHTFACHFMKNGGSIYTLSRILGHTSVSTTQIYIRGLGVEDFKEEHSRLSPLVRR
jgi:site-specific recombinase XerD